MFTYFVYDANEQVRKISITNKIITFYTFGHNPAIDRKLKKNFAKNVRENNAPQNQYRFQVNGEEYKRVDRDGALHNTAHQDPTEKYTTHFHICHASERDLEYLDVRNIIDLVLGINDEENEVLSKREIADIKGALTSFLAPNKITCPTSNAKPKDPSIYYFIAKLNKRPLFFFSPVDEKQLEAAAWLEANYHLIQCRNGKISNIIGHDAHQQYLVRKDFQAEIKAMLHHKIITNTGKILGQ